MLFIAILAINRAYAQQGSDPTSYAIPNVMTPEASDLGKYGTYSVNYYTGIPGIQIPLYEVKETDMSVPISLSYTGSGCIPNKNAGIAGMDWNINAGGAITRVVNGVPDEKYNSSYESANTNLGFIYAQQHGYQHYSKEYIRTVQYISDITAPVYNLDYEYLPDVFSFNFLGHSGKFFMDNSGVIRVAGDRDYTVSLTNFTQQYDFSISISALTGSLYDLNTKMFSQILLKSDDGYQFYFGGAFNSVEISFSCPYYGVPDPKSGVINAWYLTKVISPDGNVITFNYETYTDDDLYVIKNLFNSYSGAWLTKPADFLELKYYRSQQVSSIYRHNNSYNLGPITTNTFYLAYASIIKRAYLKEIESRTQTVSFLYSEKDLNTKFYYPDDYMKVSTATGSETDIRPSEWLRSRYSLKLDKITVADKTVNDAEGGGKRAYNFEYTYYSHRLFLTGLTVNTDGPHYSFSYAGASELPSPLSCGVDQWGYYNGHDENGTTLIGIPAVALSEYVCDLSGSVSGSPNRLPSADCLKGMLNTITYPTGGQTTFTYEQNTYSKILQRKTSAGITPAWETVSGTAGGARIKQIANTPGTTTAYKYITDYNLNPNNPSSGILSDNGIFYMHYNSVQYDGIVYGNSTETIYRLADNNIAAAASYSEPPITYKEVVEITGNGNGYTKYTFTNHATNPDNYNLGNDSYKISPEYSTTNFNNQMLRLFHYSSKEDERGKPLRTEIYSNSGSIVKSIDYTYNTSTTKEDNNVTASWCPYSLGPNWQGKYVNVVQSFALYYYQNNLTKTIEKDYGSNSSTPVTKTTTIKYKSDISNRVLERTIDEASGNTLLYKYFYPDDYSGVQPYQTMITKNMLSPVIEEQEYEVAGSATTFLHSSKTNYGFFSGNTLIKPGSVQTKVGTGNYNTRIVYNDYDQYGNLISYSKAQQNINQSLIWDYGRSRLVATVANATYGQVSYTSFETNEVNSGTDYTRWYFTGTPVILYTTAPAGIRVYPLYGKNITRTNLTASKTYKVSYWSNQSSACTITGTVGSATKGETITMGTTDWTYYEHTITGVSSITISSTATDARIDELRLYPSDAQMTTYTYDALFGITSQFDVNNKSIYYEYDDLGRLKLIRDQDKNILKKLCYNFSGQAANCGGFTNAQTLTKVFFKQGCSLLYYGSEVPYTVEAGTISSQLSQADADQQALDKLNTEGQLNANTNGTCLPKVNIYCKNNTPSKGFIITYTNIYDNSLTISYTYNSALQGVPVYIGQLPQGTYKVTITSSIPDMSYTIDCQPALTYVGQNATFNSVSVTSANCNNVTISAAN